MKEKKDMKNPCDNENNDDGLINTNLLKNIKWSYIILALIIIIGFYGTFFLPNPMRTPGRVHNIDFPSIGYHNMKENEYLSQALNQWNDGDYFRRRMHIFGSDSGPGYFEEYPQMPLLPWMIIGIWTLTGIQFWSARLIIILFSIGTIPVLFLLAKILTKDNEYIALTTAFIYSVLPVAVFFGRNIQPEAPALFFLVLGLYFFIRWIDDFQTKNIVISGLALMICALLKPTFLIGIISLLFIFPYSEVRSKLIEVRKGEKNFSLLKNATVQQLVFFAVCFFPYFIWNWITSTFLNTREPLYGGTSLRIDLFRIFTGSYWGESWSIINGFLRENFAIWFLFFTLIGFSIMLINHNQRISKFCIGYAIALLPYGMILADYVNQHNYYQMPFVPLVCICAAYCIYSIGIYLQKFLKIKNIQYAALLLLLFALPSAAVFTNYQYDTIYFGLDVGADYISSQTLPEERFFVEGGSQTFGVCFNAERRCAEISSLTDLKKAEQQLNFTSGFIHVSNGGITNLYEKPEMLDYIQNNYRITQVGVIPIEGGLQYIIVQKGGTCDLKNLTNNPVSHKDLELEKKYATSTYGNISFYTASE